MLSTATATDDDESMPTSELHEAGRCQPCAYFAFKADGCVVCCSIVLYYYILLV